MTSSRVTCWNPRFDGVNVCTRFLRTDLMVRLTESLEILKRVDKTLFERPVFSLVKESKRSPGTSDLRVAYRCQIGY